MMLEAKNVSKNFGGLAALSDVTFSVEKGQILGVIGPNGAGKTTLFNCITGVFPPSAGEIVLDGEVISGLKPHEIAKKGIARSYQITQPFGKMTALQNVMVGAFCKLNHYEQAEEKAYAALKRVKLEGYANQVAKTLNLGQRKKLEIAKALATGPKLLLLDEVMAGLTASEVSEMIEIVRSINDEGLTIIVIEHIMQAIMALSDRLLVLNFGCRIAEGTPADIQSEPRVIEAYLGVEEG